MREFTPNACFWIWGRNIDKAQAIKEKCKTLGGNVFVANDLSALIKKSQLVVSATKANKPLIFAEDIQPGTHIVGLGADGLGKNELNHSVF